MWVGKGFSGLLSVFWQFEEEHSFSKCSIYWILTLSGKKCTMYDKGAVEFSVWVAACNWVQLLKMDSNLKINML